MNRLKFITLSILGFIFFLVPLDFGGEKRIAISHIVNIVTSNFFDVFIIFTQLCAMTVLVGTLLFTIYTSKKDPLNDLFKASPLNVLMRVAGSFLYLMVIGGWFEGSLWASLIHDPNTGGLMAGDGGLLTTLYITFFAGLLFLPLLTHFGSVEFIGTLIGKFVEKVFKVPGYSAIDAIASFVGDGTIGIVVTDTQYQRGYYNRREAYIIATSFSIVGIAFASAVAEELGFSGIFPIFYGSIALVTVIIALITARMPLKKFGPEYYSGVSPVRIDVPNDRSILKHALITAEAQAGSVKLGETMTGALRSIAHIYVGFLPIIMVVGTIALVLAERTSLFNLLATPLVPLYQLIGYSAEVAAMMAPATIVGFADMYLPSLFISASATEASRFFIGVLAFTQLVFMSETGMVLAKSKIGLSFVDVVKVFVYRTALSFPILLVITNLLVWGGVLK